MLIARMCPLALTLLAQHTHPYLTLTSTKKKLFNSIAAFGGVMVDTVEAQLRGQGFIPQEPD